MVFLTFLNQAFLCNLPFLLLRIKVYFLFEKEFCICHSCLFEEVASAAGKDKKVRVKVLDGDKMYYLTFDGKKYNWDTPDEPEQN